MEVKIITTTGNICIQDRIKRGILMLIVFLTAQN